MALMLFVPLWARCSDIGDKVQFCISAWQNSTAGTENLWTLFVYGSKKDRGQGDPSRSTLSYSLCHGNQALWNKVRTNLRVMELKQVSIWSLPCIFKASLLHVFASNSGNHFPHWTWKITLRQSHTDFYFESKTKQAVAFGFFCRAYL